MLFKSSEDISRLKIVVDEPNATATDVDVNLTREECNGRIRWYLDQGISPDRLKAGVYIPE